MRPLSRSLVTHLPVSFSIFSISCSPRFADDRIPSRGLPARQVRQERLACGFVSLPLSSVRERWDRDELTLIEAGKRRVHHVLRFHDNLLRQLFDRFPSQTPE